MFQPMYGLTREERIRTSLSLGLGSGAHPYTDFAVLELTTRVPPSVASPARVRINSKVEIGEEVFVVGHPTALPRKYAESTVNFVGPILPGGDYYWAAPLDTFGGNSGSGVFSKATGELVGIHVRGAQDFIEGKGCKSIYVCPDQGPSDHPLSNPSLVEEILPLQGYEFLDAARNTFEHCGGEWQEGSTVLGAFLVGINGCQSNADCKNRGVCREQQCECPVRFFGADCSQAKSRALCNGIGENTGYLHCNCPVGASLPVCQYCDGDCYLPSDFCGASDSPAMLQLFQCPGAPIISSEAPSTSTEATTVNSAAPTIAFRGNSVLFPETSDAPAAGVETSSSAADASPVQGFRTTVFKTLFAAALSAMVYIY